MKHAKCLHGGTMTIQPERRIGRTAHWPISLLAMKYGSRPRGLWLRLHNRAWYFFIAR